MKLHIGCGKRYLPGFKHLDIIKYPHIDYVANADNLNMFEDNSIDEIYACHVLEHFNRNQIDDVLKEWNRVLIPNGILRIAVPDFESVVNEYLESGKDLNRVIGPLYGRQDYETNFHYQTFDFKRIKDVLSKNGFCKIERYDWRDFLPKDYDDYSRAYLPHMDFEKGRLMSLNVISFKN